LVRRFPLLLGGVLVGFALLPGASRMDGAGQARGTVHQIANAGSDSIGRISTGGAVTV
jgi:hypothetical protein